MVFDKILAFATATLVSLSQFLVSSGMYFRRLLIKAFVLNGLRQMYKVCSILARDMLKLITLRVILIKENGRG